MWISHGVVWSFSYDKDVKARGPAVTLRLIQSDDRAIASMSCFQNSCCYWLCLCCSVILLLPFCVWIFLTGGSWPVSHSHTQSVSQSKSVTVSHSGRLTALPVSTYCT